MMRVRPFVREIWKLGSLTVMAIVLVSSSGCDLTGQYETKFKQALEEAKRKSLFDAFLHRDFTEVVDSARQPIGVKLRLPKQFDAESKVLPQTAIPGLTEIQGSAYTLMRELDDNSGQKATCIVQIVAVPKAAQKGEPIQAMITKLATALVPGSAPKWEDVSLPNASGQTVALKRMRLDKQVPVMNAKGGGGKMVASLSDLYLVDAGANDVVIAWQVPRPQAQKHNLEMAIEASMGTVEVAAPAADAEAGKASGAAGGKTTPGCF